MTCYVVIAGNRLIGVYASYADAERAHAAYSASFPDKAHITQTVMQGNSPRSMAYRDQHRLTA